MRALLLLCLLSCSLPAVEPLREHTVPGSRLLVSAPADWTVSAEAQAGGAALVLRSPPAPGPEAPAGSPAHGAALRAGAALAVVTQAVEPGTTIAGFADASVADLRRLAPHFTIVEPLSTITLAGREWRRLRYRFNTGQLVWEQLLVCSVDGEQGWCVTASSDSAHFADWIAQFTQAVEALRTGD